MQADKSKFSVPDLREGNSVLARHSLVARERILGDPRSIDKSHTVRTRKQSDLNEDRYRYLKTSASFTILTTNRIKDLWFFTFS